MTDRDRANHEASHAVVWWWWVNDPHANRDDQTGGWFDHLSIENNGGHFAEGVHHLVTRDEVKHITLSLLAGPVSDELRGKPRGALRDEQKARELLEQISWVSDVGGYVETTRSEVMDMLADPFIREMVGVLAGLLVVRRSVSFDEATTVLRPFVDRALGT